MIIDRLYCFAFILLLAFGQSSLFKLTSYLVRRYVRIVNHLNNKPLTYHCEFADDDFGNVCFTFPALHASIVHDVYIYMYVDTSLLLNHSLWRCSRTLHMLWKCVVPRVCDWNVSQFYENYQG